MLVGTGCRRFRGSYPAESVARAKLDLALPGDASYSRETIQRIRRSLRCDYVVHGAFFDPGKSAGGRVQLDLRLYNAKSGEVLASVSESGSEVALPDLAARVGVALRGKLGAPGISRSQSAELQAAVPSTPEATRLYFQGLGQLRSFDLLGAQDSLTNATKEDPNFPGPRLPRRNLARSALTKSQTGSQKRIRTLFPSRPRR